MEYMLTMALATSYTTSLSTEHTVCASLCLMPALRGSNPKRTSDKHETPRHVDQTTIYLPCGVLLKGHFALRAVLCGAVFREGEHSTQPSYTARPTAYFVACIAAPHQFANPLTRTQRFHLFMSIGSRHRRTVVAARELLPHGGELPHISRLLTATGTERPAANPQVFIMQNVSFTGTNHNGPTWSLP
ncbi:hypothetical protein P171DRAFT_176775 [Karstenula rhodostoma CBS 690.94]|uniref:Uncharacterized protein n=1 Tax=Karstenula rhodostoma CBS 690.94 TaxID=1392251 RepID=A0A9P4P751_9PLEO|nr:hypothetical protein P171DRAFT_176775 [Karstenula rhodostoma CBS 690.94]